MGAHAAANGRRWREGQREAPFAENQRKRQIEASDLADHVREHLAVDVACFVTVGDFHMQMRHLLAVLAWLSIAMLRVTT